MRQVDRSVSDEQLTMKINSGSEIACAGSSGMAGVAGMAMYIVRHKHLSSYVVRWVSNPSCFLRTQNIKAAFVQRVFGRILNEGNA
jgi:hypothetical protein